MASRTGNTTTDHDEIRRWAEARGGKPARVLGTARGNNDTGMIRIDFPGYSGAGKLEEIGWDEWFEKFDEGNLALVYQEKTARGQQSNFNKLVGRETASARAGGNNKASRRSLRGGARKTGTRRSNTGTAKRTTAKKRGATAKSSRTRTTTRGTAKTGTRTTTARRGTAKTGSTRAPSRGTRRTSARSAGRTARGGTPKSPTSRGVRSASNKRAKTSGSRARRQSTGGSRGKR